MIILHITPVILKDFFVQTNEKTIFVQFFECFFKEWNTTFYKMSSKIVLFKKKNHLYFIFYGEGRMSQKLEIPSRCPKDHIEKTSQVISNIQLYSRNLRTPVPLFHRAILTKCALNQPIHTIRVINPSKIRNI